MPTEEYTEKAEPEHVDQDEDNSRLMANTKEWLKAELGEKYNEPMPLATPSQLKEGQVIYVKYCAACHGTTGEGNGPAGLDLKPRPANFTDSIHAAFYSGQGRMHIIKKGMSGTAMVGWEKTLNDKEISSVYAYINSLKN